MVTQHQIARELGISRSTVAAVLSKQPTARLTSEMHRKVALAAEKLGYRPHRHAQIMRRGKSGTIGMIQSDGTRGFAPQRAFYAAKVVYGSGFDLLSGDASWHQKGYAAACAEMLEARVEGLLLIAPAESFSMKELERFREARIPVVSLSGVRLPEVPQVVADVRQGVYDLTRYLLKLGHRRLTYLAGDKTSPMPAYWPTYERVEGFRKAIESVGGQIADEAKNRDDASIEAIGSLEKGARATPEAEPSENAPEGRIVYWPSFTTDSDWMDPFRAGELAMRVMLQVGARPDALVCANDDYAFGALKACAEAGVRVPEDLAITGFDNTVISNYGTTPITTVAQPIEKMAERAVEILIKLIRGDKLLPEEQLVKMPCSLVVRRSCGAALTR